MASLSLQTTSGITSRGHVPDHKFTPGCVTRVAYRPVAFAKMAMVQCKPATKERTGISGGPERFDRWMRESVAEIVKNLEQAPLFVHVYGGKGESTVKTEKAVAEDWAELKGKWVKGEEPSPEGIILVEELKEDDVGIYEEEEDENNEGHFGDCTKAFGVLIQGKGEDGGVACYLLKTCRVGGGSLGLFCTHYCLVKVKSFRETAKSQLTKCWLA